MDTETLPRRNHHTHSEVECSGLFLNNTTSSLNIGCLSNVHPPRFLFDNLPTGKQLHSGLFSLVVLDLLLLEPENKILPHHSSVTRSDLRFLLSVVFTMGYGM